MPRLAAALGVTLLVIVIAGTVEGLAATTIAGLAGAAVLGAVVVGVWLWG